MLLFLKTALVLASLAEVFKIPIPVSGLRPVYIIAHMVNSISELDHAMGEGANSIETDVTFDRSGNATKMYHGRPCDCFRKCTNYERVPDFLRYVRKTTDPCKQIKLPSDRGKYRKKLLFLFLDLKVQDLHENKKYLAGTDIAMQLLRSLWQGVSPRKAMNVLLSVPSVRDKDVFQGAISAIRRHAPAMLKRIGFDVSNNDKLENIRRLYQELGISRHRWQGDGISNCVSFLRPDGRMRAVISNRDSRRADHYVDKAYQWTIDTSRQLRRSLRRGIDGIITNKPRRMASILTEREFKRKLRLANIHDSPWTRGQISPKSHHVVEMDILGH